MAYEPTRYTGTMVVASGGTGSNALPDGALYNRKSLTIIAPGTLPETANIEVDRGDGSYAVLQSPAGTDIVIAAGKAVVLSFGGFLPFFGLRIKTGATAAERTFHYVAGA